MTLPPDSGYCFMTIEGHEAFCLVTVFRRGQSKIAIQSVFIDLTALIDLDKNVNLFLMICLPSSLDFYILKITIYTCSSKPLQTLRSARFFMLMVSRFI